MKGTVEDPIETMVRSAGRDWVKATFIGGTAAPLDDAGARHEVERIKARQAI